jgi:hypothetical protein
MQAGTELTLPLTPRHAMLATRKVLPTPEVNEIIYVPLTFQFIVDELNRTTRAYALNEIVSITGETRSCWFEDGPIPSDAWENTEEGKAFAEHPECDES